MKFMKYKNIFFFTLVFTAFSCEDFIGGDLNQDPNKPGSVPIAGILPQVQISLVDTYGGSFSRWNCMFTQQVEGVARQWSAFNKYTITPNRFDDSWSDLYENVLVELKTINAEAVANGYNHYLGIAKILEAYTIMIMTDVWGDIPYTEANLGSENFNPVFDDQATVIYPAVKTLIDEAVVLFGDVSGDIVPGGEDLIYGGKLASWEKAANAILARYHLHLGEYEQALAAAQKSFTSSADDMSYTYGATPDGGQWYRFNDGRTGDIEFHPTMRKLMTSLNDTVRLGVLDNVFTTSGHPYLVDAFKQDLISYREIQFIIAEVAFRLPGMNAVAHTAYLNGIRSSFKEIGLTTADAGFYLLQASVNPGEGNITLDHIITQKYIGLFVQPEVFSDWRRTGIPALEAVSGKDGIPRRWDYSFNEYLFNSEAPEQDPKILFQRVDWDKP